MMSTRRLSLKWHGLVVGEATLGDDRRVILAEVPSNSPAEAAGFRPGDQVIRVGELAVTNSLDIERGLMDAQPGQPTAVIVMRDGHEQSLPIDVRPLNQRGDVMAMANIDASNQVLQTLGLKVTAVNSAYVAAASTELHGGLYVESVVAGSPAARASIQKGDILVGLDVGKRHLETVVADNVVYVLRLPEVATSPRLPYWIVRSNVIHTGAMSMADIARSGTTLAR